MTMRLLEKKIQLTLDSESVEPNRPIELEYYLIESSIDYIEELAGKKVFGIEIVKKELSNGEGPVVESRTVRNFSCCKDTTRIILGKLADNTVTPVGLPFVLDDLIGV